MIYYEDWNVVSDDWNYDCDCQRCWNYKDSKKAIISVDVSIIEKIVITLDKTLFNLEQYDKIVFVNNKRAELIFTCNHYKYMEILKTMTYEELIDLIENEEIDIEAYMICKKLSC